MQNMILNSEELMPIEHDTRIRFLRIYPKVTD